MLDLLSQFPGWSQNQTLSSRRRRRSRRRRKNRGGVNSDRLSLLQSNRFRIHLVVGTYNGTVSSLQIGLMIDVHNGRKEILQGTT